MASRPAPPIYLIPRGDEEVALNESVRESFNTVPSRQRPGQMGAPKPVVLRERNAVPYMTGRRHSRVPSREHRRRDRRRRSSPSRGSPRRPAKIARPRTALSGGGPSGHPPPGPVRGGPPGLPSHESPRRVPSSRWPFGSRRDAQSDVRVVGAREPPRVASRGESAEEELDLRGGFAGDRRGDHAEHFSRGVKNRRCAPPSRAGRRRPRSPLASTCSPPANSTSPSRTRSRHGGSGARLPPLLRRGRAVCRRPGGRSRTPRAGTGTDDRSGETQTISRVSWRTVSGGTTNASAMTSGHGNRSASSGGSGQELAALDGVAQLGSLVDVGACSRRRGRRSGRPWNRRVRSPRRQRRNAPRLARPPEVIESESGGWRPSGGSRGPIGDTPRRRRSPPTATPIATARP